MSLAKSLGRLLDTVGLKKPLNEFRFSITRPEWWREKRATYRFYSQFFRPGELCFDVGANDGGFAEMLCELGGRVVVIEPQPACLPGIQEKLARFKSFVVVNKAVGSQEGILDILLAGEGSQISSMSEEWIKNVKRSNRFPGHDWERKIRVPVTTLDRLIEQHGIPAFCKIDVEGYETEVLKGLNYAPRFLSFEYTPENRGAVTACIKRIAEIGDFKFNVAIHQQRQFFWERWLHADEALSKLERTNDLHLLKGGDVYASSQRRS